MSFDEYVWTYYQIKRVGSGYAVSVNYNARELSAEEIRAYKMLYKRYKRLNAKHLIKEGV